MLLNLVEEQLRLGLQPAIASIGDKAAGQKPVEAEAIERGITVKTFRMRPGPNYWGALKILAFARSNGYQALHCHGYKGDILFGLLPKQVRRLPVVATLHGWTSTPGMSKMAIYEKLDQLSLNLMDTVVLVNEAMKQHPRLRGAKHAKFRVINNGLPPLSASHSGQKQSTAFPEKPEETSATHRDEIIDFCLKGCAIGSIGRLSGEKGHRYLIRAFQLLSHDLPDVRIIIIGEGSEREALESMVNRFQLCDRVLLPGYRKNARTYMPFFKVFVLPSLTEGLPITLLEAMQEGVPVVATRVGGMARVLDDGKTGMLVPPGDDAALAEGIRQVLTDAEFAGRMRLAAAKIVADHYTSAAMAKQYSEVYQAVLSDCLN